MYLETKNVSLFNYICDSCNNFTCSISSPKRIRLLADTTKKTVDCILGFGYSCQIEVGNDEKVIVYLQDLGIQSVCAKGEACFLWKRATGYATISPQTYTWCKWDSCEPCQDLCYRSGNINYYLRAPRTKGDSCNRDVSCFAKGNEPPTPCEITRSGDPAFEFKVCDPTADSNCKKLPVEASAAAATVTVRVGVKKKSKKVVKRRRKVVKRKK